MLLATSSAMAALATTAAFHGGHHHLPRHHHIRMQQDPPPPDLDDRQAAFMKQRGFRWNAKSRSWVKGDIKAKLQRLECRSGARVLRVVTDGHADENDEKLLLIRKAMGRFEAALQEAREKAIGDNEEDRQMRLQLKDRIATPWAPYAWLVAQLSCIAYLLNLTGALLQEVQPSSWIIPIGIGAAFAPLLSTLRREKWRRQPGVEDGDGALERLLVDAQLGSYALPGPWEWRASEPLRWGAVACAAESLASVNTVLCWHSGVEAAVTSYTAPWMGDAAAIFIGVLVVAAAAAGRAQYFYDGSRDGLPAEVDAARRLKAKAQSYYGMTAASPEEAALSCAVTTALADEWTQTFQEVEEDDDEARFAQLALAVASTALCALAWELSGRSFIAPSLALALASLDLYVLRPDTERCRATITLGEAILSRAAP